MDTQTQEARKGDEWAWGRRRRGLTLLEVAEMFPDEASARRWFERQVWPDGERCCVRCGSCNTYRAKHRTMPYRCRDCDSHFSVKTGTALESSKLPLQKWVWAIYLELSHVKNMTSVKLAEDIGVTQKTAWFMLHRIRTAYSDGPAMPFYPGPVEVDETYVGGKEKNKHRKKRKGIRGGTGGKTAVVGAKDRASNQVVARAIPRVDAQSLLDFVERYVHPDTMVYTDGASPYKRRENHESVAHSKGEYAQGDVHTNGIESLWAVLKRAYMGTHHWMSPKHLHRYLDEVCGRLNIRRLDMTDQMRAVVFGMVGKRLLYRDLVDGPPANAPLT